jgi:hypothetical protein
MAKKLTPEERAQRDLDRKAAKIAEREAKRAAQVAQWAAEKQLIKDQFEAGLTEKDKLAIYRVLHTSKTKVDPFGQTVPDFGNDFIESLSQQYISRGHLSPAQLMNVVKTYDRMVETEEQVKVWPSIAEGDDVMVLCTVTAVDQRPNTGFGPSWKIKLRSHYGRLFQINTAAARFLSVAREALKDNLKVNVQGKAGWVSPDTKIVVLDKKGLYFKGL